MVFWRRPKPRRGNPARRAGTALGHFFRTHARLETLEDRCVPAALSVGANVNISRRFGNQDELALAINPTNPDNIVAVSIDETVFQGNRFYRSTDGGVTWTSRLVGTGTGAGGDGLPSGCCDGQLAFDNFGNLFMVYLSNFGTATVLRSSNGGQTLTLLADFVAGDQPSVAAAAGMVWVSYFSVGGTIIGRGAPVTGLGMVGAFTGEQIAIGSTTGNFGNIAISPDGQVSVSYQLPVSGIGPSQIFVHTDPDGFGPFSFSASTAFPTNVGGFRLITPNNTQHGIDAEVVLAYDHSFGPRRGRLYAVYTDAANTTTDDTDIFLRISNDNGRTFGPAIRVNDVTRNSQFLPSIAVDPVTGNLAIGWMDSRNSGSAELNLTAQYFLTASVNGGINFLPSVQVSTGTSRLDTSGSVIVGYGDYLIFDMFNNVIRPIWADNSPDLGNNPDLPSLDVATAAVTLTDAPGPVPNPNPGPIPTGEVIVTGADAGTAPLVRIIDASTGNTTLEFFAYDKAFTGGVRVARGDVTGDGVADIITGAGPGGGPHIRVFDGVSGFQVPSPAANFFAYDERFRGGVFVAAGDMNGDGIADIMTSAGPGGGAHIKVFDGSTGNLLRSFFAYDLAFRGGATVAAGDFNDDGLADIVTGQGPGGSSNVKVFSGATNSQILNLFAYDKGFLGGVFVAAGDLTGDGVADLITGPGQGGGGHVKAFDGATQSTILSFFAYNTSAGDSRFSGDTRYVGGARVAVADINLDGIMDIVTGPGLAGQARVRAFDGTNAGLLREYLVFPGFLGGMFVG